MHRALEIVNAAVALLQANTNLAASVYAHRVLSLAAEELEVPAVSVRMGVDTILGQRAELPVVHRQRTGTVRRFVGAGRVGAGRAGKVARVARSDAYQFAG